VGLTIKETGQLLSERGLNQNGMVQTFVDNEAVRLMAPYTPVDSTTLRNSAYSGTTFGSGEINQNTPYAGEQYYNENLRHRGITTHHWFEAMKENGGKVKILDGAAKLAGAKAVQK
jgi:hypothetical protein